MPITLEITAYGDAAHDALARAVDRHKRDDPLRSITVVVPSNYMGIAARRALGRRRGAAAVSFLRAHQVAELLGSAAVSKAGKRPVSNPVLAGAVRAVLGREPGRFEGVHTHPATERSLVKAHKDLSEIPTETLKEMAAASSRTSEVIRVHRAVNREIGADYYNEQDLVDAAVEAIESGASTLTDLGPTVLFLPQRMKPGQIRLVAALGRHHELHVIAATTGVAEADAPVRLAVEQLGMEWSPPDSITAPVADRALSVSDADDEVRHALRSIVHATLDGTRLDRCAVLYGSGDPYARMLADALDAAGIEWHGQSVRTTDSSLAGRSLLGLLALGDHDFSRHDVFAWLASAPVRRTSGLPVPVAAWERASRAAGVVSGLDQWSGRLARLVDDRNADAQRFEGDEEHEWRAERLRREAAHASDLADFVDGLATALRPPGRMTWSAIADWCSKLIGLYFGDEKSRSDWPTHEQRAADSVEAAVKRIGDLDGIDPNPSLAAFRRALELELGDDPGRHGTFGRGVLVGPVSLGIGLELDRVVVLGLAEGTMPARRRDDPLLPDRVRAAAGTALATRADRIGDDHRGLLAVMATASHAICTFPRGDLRRNAQRAPSRWLLDSCEARDGVRPTAEELARSTGDWLTEAPSFIAGLRSTAFPAHEQEYDMRALLDWVDDGHDARAAPALKARPELRLGVDLITNRYSHRFTRFDGNLTEKLRHSGLESLKTEGQVTSASRLEQWAKCPHAYLVRHVLGVNPVEDPEEQYRINPMDFGKLVHRVLERWIEEARTADALPAAHEPWSREAVARLIEIGREEAESLERRGSVGRAVYWRRQKQVFLYDLEKFSGLESAWRRADGARPLASELSFGLPASDRGAVTVRLPDGRSIELRGAIDRVDQTADGKLLVIDYKTGSSKKYKRLLEDPLSGGTSLQLLLYAIATRGLLDSPGAAATGSYWFVTRRGGFERYGYAITPGLEAEGLRTVTGIIDGIESGLFPARPAAPQYRTWVDCRFCDPDGLGLAHQHSDWKRKSDDDALAPYLEIIGDDHG